MFGLGFCSCIVSLATCEISRTSASCALNFASLPFSMSTRTLRMPRCASTAASQALRMYWRARRRTLSSKVIAAPVDADTPGLNS